MKKRLFALFLAVATMLPLIFASCGTATNSGEVITEDEIAARKPKTVVLTLMTGDETTDEAIKAVQDEINSITTQRFKTQVILRYFKESEYEEKIDQIVADIAEERTLQAELDSIADASEKESKRHSAIDKLIAADKDDGARKSKWYKEEVQEEESETEFYETEFNILGASVEKYPTASATQMDVFLICGAENLTKYVSDEAYATDGESFLLQLDEMLASSASELNHYLNPNTLAGGKVGNGTYAIPTNRQLASEYTYLVLDKALVAKYGIDESKITGLTDKETIKYLNAVSAGETDVSPILNSLAGLYDKVDEDAFIKPISLADAPGIVGIFSGETTIFGTYVSNASSTGMKSVPKNILNQWQYTEFYTYMKQFERNGYFCEEPTKDTKYALAVVEGDEAYPSTMDSSKYIVKVLEKPIASTETVGEYMLGISKYAENADRCMELITFLNTNSEFRNLLQYGIKGVNYKIEEDTGKLVRLNHDYMMNIYTTGNTFIAYPEEDMSLDVWEKAKETNKSTLVSPYLGFVFENENNAELIKAAKQLSDEMFKKVNDFNPEAARLAKIEECGNVITSAEATLQTLRADYVKLVAAYEPFRVIIDPIQKQYDGIKARLDAANVANKPFKDEVTKLQAEVDKYTATVEKQTADIATTQAKIDEINASETPDLEMLDFYQKNIKIMQDTLADAQKKLDAAQPKLDAAKTAMEPTQAAVDAIMAEIAPVEEKLAQEKEKATAEKTALDENVAQTTANEELIAANQKLIDSLQYTTSEEYDQIVFDLYESFFSQLNAEIRKNETYSAFMNPEAENGVVYIYNDWYDAMYG